MGEETKAPLAPSQEDEARLLGEMITRGVPLATIETRWKRFVEKLMAGETLIDLDALIQFILKESYLAMTEELRLYGEEIRFLVDAETQIRDYLSEPQEHTQSIEEYIQSWDERLSAVGEDTQWANIDLQGFLQKLQHTLQLMTNASKMLHDTLKAVIRKI
jgi:hypothetical protein